MLGILLAAFAVGASGASAGTGSCPGTPVYPFTPWGDANPYLPVPGGDFESTKMWKLSGGAKIRSDNEPFFVNGTSDARSLSLPAGSSATTPEICVTLLTPTLRFFAVGGSSGSDLMVDVTTTVFGKTLTQTVAKIPAPTSWGPSPIIFFGANLASLASSDGVTTVKFRFWTTGKGTWRIDDVYVDPRKGW